MNDIQFQAALKSAKLTARKNPDNPNRVIRRVHFSLCRAIFGIVEAEWLGKVGIELLHNLQGRALNKGEIPINGYHAIAEFSGLAGNASANIDGLVAKAAVVGDEDNEHEEITFEFEAPCEAKLLTFFGASIKDHIDCDIKRMQQEFALGEPNESGVRTATVQVEYDEASDLEGTGEERP